MTVKLKSNLYVGPGNILPNIFTLLTTKAVTLAGGNGTLKIPRMMAVEHHKDEIKHNEIMRVWKKM